MTCANFAEGVKVWLTGDVKWADVRPQPTHLSARKLKFVITRGQRWTGEVNKYKTIEKLSVCA